MIDEENAKVKEARQFLRENYLMTLATVNARGPSVAVVVYVLDPKGNLYFVTHANSRKARNLSENPAVSLVIWQSGQNMLVQADGKASKVEEVQTEEWVMDCFADLTTKDVHSWPPLLRMQNKEYAVFRVTLHWMRTLDLTRSTVTQEESPFTEIPV